MTYAAPHIGDSLTGVGNAWKWIGLAGVVGVAASGVLVARDQRQRNAYSADDIRDRLRKRYEEIDSPDN
ncbi:hypothetical protein [Williamsia sp. 1135]|uniref:hypothetical protein n=1 Tax=Williamsia sp. 1135 TaxID=1889262 RepID=UPI000A0FE497|nr:hypothetical protein [Williamsia sp. 1135]ORM30556.1 hypothetical protein BFL43_18085 [Williamsia sp. 1135]